MSKDQIKAGAKATGSFLLDVMNIMTMIVMAFQGGQQTYRASAALVNRVRGE